MGWNYLFIPKLQCCSCWSLGIWLCTVLYGLPKFLIEKLQRVQNFSAQLFSGSYKYDHITPVLKSLHWLPVEQRIWYKIAVLGFKCVYGSAPSYLQNLVELYTPRQTLRRSNDKLTLSIPKVRTLYGERSFRYHCAVEWNTLQYDIRSCESLDSFKAKLKTFFFLPPIMSNCLLSSAVNNVLFTECFNEIYWNLFVSYKFTQI